MKKIGIVGYGYVGKAIAQFFEGKFTLEVYDPNMEAWRDKAGHIFEISSKEDINDCDLAIVCVPTPMKEATGEVDISIIEDVFSWLKAPLIVIKSTIPPGTTSQLADKFNLRDKLVFSPEYIGEGGYPVPFWEGVPHPTDMKLHKTFIFGGNYTAVEKIIPFFAKVRGAFAEYRTTDSTTAELTKYMENAWIATKVTFCNEFYDIAKRLGVSYIELRELWLTDARVGKSHTIVYPDKRGFDGKCIPKDTNGIVNLMEVQYGYTPLLLDAVLKANNKFNKKQ